MSLCYATVLCHAKKTYFYFFRRKVKNCKKSFFRPRLLFAADILFLLLTVWLVRKSTAMCVCVYVCGWVGGCVWGVSERESKEVSVGSRVRWREGTEREWERERGSSDEIICTVRKFAFQAIASSGKLLVMQQQQQPQQQWNQEKVWASVTEKVTPTEKNILITATTATASATTATGSTKSGN